VAVNVSGRELSGPSLGERVAATLRRHRLRPAAALARRVHRARNADTAGPPEPAATAPPVPGP